MLPSTAPESCPSLQSRLAAALPLGVHVQAYHVSTPASAHPPIFAPTPAVREKTTFCESHFLAVSSPRHDDQTEILVYAVEILVFTCEDCTILFVSKADSSGFSSRLQAPRGSGSVIGTIVTALIHLLLEPRLHRSRVVLSLFARSQNQYLFPGSIENPGKHVLDDRNLVKWWCRLLDNVLRSSSPGFSREVSATAHLVVPGCDKAETKAFFPPSARLDSLSEPKWTNSYPVELLVPDVTRPPRYLVPRLPDDPKCRFLDDLDQDFVDDRGQWRSIKTLDQFWDMMSYRQECSAGRLVGFLWMVFSPSSTQAGQKPSHPSTGLQPMDASMEVPAATNLLTPQPSQVLDNGTTALPQPTAVDGGFSNVLQSPPASSPIAAPAVASVDVNSTDKAEGQGPSDDSTASQPPAISNLPAWLPKQTPGEVVISGPDYDSLMEHLLQTDFAGEEPAAGSTRGWIQKVLDISHASSFGVVVHGTRVLTQSNGSDVAPSRPVNVLTGVRKKRKVGNLEGSSASDATVPFVTAEAISLGAELVQKRPKN